MFTQPLPRNLLNHYAQRSGRDAQHPPTLLLVAFEGWNDAGEAASDALKLMAQHYQSKPLKGFESEPFYSYTESRPQLIQGEHSKITLKWPQTHFSEAWDTAGARILTLTGQEPSLNWVSYSEHVTQLIHREEVDLVIFCGALLDEVPHTRPAPVSISSSSPSVLTQQGIEESTYTGPTGIVGVLAHTLGQQDIPSLSLWASLPHYLAHPPHPKATFALLSTLETISGIPMPLEKLADELIAWERGAEELLEDEPELLAYVHQLEVAHETAEDIRDISHIDIAAEFEQYLKDQDGDDKPPSTA